MAMRRSRESHGIETFTVYFCDEPYSSFLLRPPSLTHTLTTHTHTKHTPEPSQLIPFLAHYSTLHLQTPTPPPTPSQHQPKRRHLKRPQLNMRGPIHPNHTLPVILQHITPHTTLHIQPTPQHPPCPPAQTLIHPHNHTPALSLRQLPPADIIVVFAALDAVEDESWGTGQGDGAEEGGGGGECGRGMRVEAHRVVEVIRGADGAGVEGAGVGEDGEADVVAT